MQTKDYVITALVIAVVCLSILTYALITAYPLTRPASQPETSTPTPTPVTLESPIPTVTPSQTPQPTMQVSIPKPSVPEFTIAYVDRSYDLAPFYTKDPYTGEMMLRSPGEHVTNMSIDVTIKNQAFISPKPSDGNVTQLCYYVRSKGYFEDWQAIIEYNFMVYNNSQLIRASSSDYTVLDFPLDSWYIRPQPGGQIDFQVKALIVTFYHTNPGDPWSDHIYGDVIAEGDWSNTQTFTIPKTLSS